MINSLLPQIVTKSVPGPKSLELAARLKNVECAEITYISENASSPMSMATAISTPLRHSA
jgi:hypothetical protein